MGLSHEQTGDSIAGVEDFSYFIIRLKEIGEDWRLKVDGGPSYADVWILFVSLFDEALG